MQLTKKCPRYTYRKDGVYYFSKAVPKDLLDLYCKPRIVKCLGTRSPQSAQFVAKAMLEKLEDYWLGLANSPQASPTWLWLQIVLIEVT